MKELTPSEMGKRGAAARNKNMTAAQKEASARKAAVARWTVCKHSSDYTGPCTSDARTHRHENGSVFFKGIDY